VFAGSRPNRRAQARSLGELEPGTSNIGAGALHRAWINLKSVSSDQVSQKYLMQEFLCAQGKKNSSHLSIKSDDLAANMK
jgi:hypothetical protein